MGDDNIFAPGWPGIQPRWTSSAKSGIGTALSLASRVWFTLSHGILNEVYYPRVDLACTRDCGFLVTSAGDFFSEEKRHTTSSVELMKPGVPAYRLSNTCTRGTYRIDKEIVSDPWNDVVLQKVRLIPLKGSLDQFHLYCLLAPHIGNHGFGNTAWVDRYKGVPMLFAMRDDVAIALASSIPWLKRSVGFVGASDGWQDISRHKEMTWEYTRAENGNVAMTGEVDLKGSGGQCVIALAFGRNPAEAGLRAILSLRAGFEYASVAYVEQWEQWLEAMHKSDSHLDGSSAARLSLSVMRVHEDKRFRGGVIASLSMPWGQAKSDDDLGGYHLVWVRDLAEAAGGLLAAGAHHDVKRVLEYLRATQEQDGHWTQNMWLDGRSYWTGIQLDEAAFPILLLELGVREKMLTPGDVRGFEEMIYRAAGYIVRNGPVTAQDRWEEDAGYSPFTLAVEIAALIAAATFLDGFNDHAAATYLRETADAWNDNLERWCYVEGTAIAREAGARGYYVRIAPPEVADASSPAGGFVPIKNRPMGENAAPASRIVSTDALALVRFGLRAADDPRIIDTVKVIDHMLKVETPAGPAWHRYNEDGYGEHADGAPYDGTGIGRAWPLLTGERGHYELAAGHHQEARRLLKSLESLTSQVGLIPEQVWDSPDVPERELFFGKPAGSAMPLVWAHAEHIKLVRSVRSGKVFDLPGLTFERYVKGKSPSRYIAWRFNNKCKAVPRGKGVRIEVLAPAMMRWTTDEWRTHTDTDLRGNSLGIYTCDIPAGSLPAGGNLRFTFQWKENLRWEGAEFCIRVGG